jgi:hypothetical protein
MSVLTFVCMDAHCADMPSENVDKRLAGELSAMLAEGLPGIEVSVGRSDRWNRMCVTFVWSDFAGLLPEERFERLTRHIPQEYREKKLGGFIWLELAPNESVDDFLKLPRSEDVSDREAEIYGRLESAGFFEDLGNALRPEPQKTCSGDFSRTLELLKPEKAVKKAIALDAKLLFIRHGAYCDCQALLTVRPQLARRHGRTP